MKKFIPKIFLYILFITSLIICYTIAQPYLTKIFPDDFRRHATILRVLHNKYQKAEILVFGDSRTMFGVNTHVISREIPGNPVAFNLSSVDQTILEGAYFFPEIDPKVKIVIHCIPYDTFDEGYQNIKDSKALSLILSGLEIHESARQIIPQIHPYFERSKYRNYFDARTRIKSSIHYRLRMFFDNEILLTNKYEDIYFPYIYQSERHPNYPDSYVLNYDSLKIRPDKVKLVNRIFSYFKKKGIKYYLVLMPVNPDVFSLDPSKDSMYVNHLREILPQIPVITLQNILTQGEFYDGIHPNRSGAEKVSRIIALKIKQ